MTRFQGLGLLGAAALLVAGCGGNTSGDITTPAAIGNGKGGPAAGNAAAGSPAANGGALGSAAAGAATGGTACQVAASTVPDPVAACVGKRCGENCSYPTSPRIPCAGSTPLDYEGSCDANGVCQWGSKSLNCPGSGGSGSTDFSACGPTDTCIVESADICGVGCEPVAQAQYVAINAVMKSAYWASLQPHPCLTNGACAAVATAQLATPNYYATCTNGHCQVNDLRQTDLSACTTAADCGVRAGTSCCGCGSTDWVAVRVKANVEQVFCAPSAGCALDCVGAPRTDLGATCNPNGHCALYMNLPD